MWVRGPGWTAPGPLFALILPLSAQTAGTHEPFSILRVPGFVV